MYEEIEMNEEMEMYDEDEIYEVEVITKQEGNPIWKKVKNHWYLLAKHLGEQHEDKELGERFIQFVGESEFLERKCEKGGPPVYEFSWSCDWKFQCKDNIFQIHEGGSKHFSSLSCEFGSTCDYADTKEPLAEFVYALLRKFDEEWHEIKQEKSA